MTTQGLLEQGNINLHARPIVRNADGSISTVRSMSFEQDGQEILIPTVSPDGKILSDEAAMALYRKTGEHLGKFDNAADATAYAQSLHDQQAAEYLPKVDQPPSKNFYPAPIDFTPSSIAGGTAGLGDIVGAAAEQMRLVDNTDAASTALEEAYRQRIDAIKRATGIDLPNPLVPNWTADDARAADAAAAQPGLPDPDAGTKARDAVIARQRRDYAARLSELEAQFPQHSAIIKATTPIENDAQALARGADARLGELMASHPGWDGAAASFVGSAGGSLRDPVVIGSLFMGGGPGAARTVFGRLLSTAVSEALVNGAATAVSQPAVQAWRREAGLPNGFEPAAQNVLMAATLGAGIGVLGRSAVEAIGVLQKIRPALKPEARGAIDAAETSQALQQVKPAGVEAPRHEAVTAAADSAVQAPERVVPPPAPSDVEINRIVNSLAPSPESVSGQVAGRSDASIDNLVSALTNPPKAALGAPTPILDHLRRMGGVDPKSPAAEELRAAGVTAKSVFKKGGLSNLDNLPHDELPAEARHTIAQDGNGYADRDALVQAASAEANGYGAGRTVDDAAGIREHYERQGVDFSAPIAEVRAAVRAVDDAETRFSAASGSNGLHTDEVVAVPAGFTRRQHTEQLVREVLRLQPGLQADHVRQAVNLALFEHQPIEQAVSDVMSASAGVAKKTPDGAFSDLGSQPPALLEEPAFKPEDAQDKVDFAAEHEAMKELGFDGGVLPGGGEDLVTIEDLEQSIKDAHWLERVVETCKT